MSLFPKFGTPTPAKVAKPAKAEPIPGGSNTNFRNYRNFRKPAGPHNPGSTGPIDGHRAPTDDGAYPCESCETCESAGRLVDSSSRAVVGAVDPGLALSARTFAAVPPCPATVTERAALIEGDDCDRVEADRRALAEFGLSSWADLADVHAAEISVALDRLPVPTSLEGRRLLKVTRDFLETEHWRQAIAHGWPLVEQFGVHAFAPLVRIEAWGVVPRLAWSPLSPIGIASVTANEIVMACRSTHASLMHRAGSRGMELSVVWWVCPALVGEVAP